MQISMGKTEVLTSRCADNSHTLIENDILWVVEKFVFPGCELRKNGDIMNEISIIIGKLVLRLRVSLGYGLSTVYR